MVHGDRPVYSREGETEGTNGLTKKLERVGERKPRLFYGAYNSFIVNRRRFTWLTKVEFGQSTATVSEEKRGRDRKNELKPPKKSSSSQQGRKSLRCTSPPRPSPGWRTSGAIIKTWGRRPPASSAPSTSVELEKNHNFFLFLFSRPVSAEEWPGGGGGIHLFGEAAAAIATMLQFPLFIIHKNFLE